jgi:serine phosphatase RsbU (regulator of sigma subunit)
VAADDGLLGDALRGAQHAPPDHLIEALAEPCRAAGVEDPALFLVDHEGQALTTVAADPGHTVPVAGSVPGRVFLSQLPAETAEEGGTRLWLPVSESRCRLGVLSVLVAELDDDRRRWCADLAEVVAQLVRTRQQYTDTFYRARRSQPMALAAELQWTLLPPLDFVCEGLAVAGLVEPAYHIGGDVFDYAVNEGVVHFGIVDSMGHALNSAIVAGLVIGTYRNRRRADSDLVATVEALDEAVMQQFGGDRFATVGLGELDTRTGECRWLNAGHPLPLVARGTSIEEVACAPRLPVGLGGGPGEVSTVVLEPGDRFVCFSDGVTDATDPSGEHFGEHRLFAALESGAEASAGEVVHRVIAGAIEHQGGRQRDDATMLLLELGRANEDARPARRQATSPGPNRPASAGPSSSQSKRVPQRATRQGRQTRAAETKGDQ